MSGTAPRIAVAGWIGSSNIGDELIFAELRRRILERGGSCLALSIDPSATVRTHGGDAVRHAGPGDAVRLYRDLADARALVFGGGGLIQSETSPWNLPFHLSRVWTARLRRLPWVGVGLGVGDVHGRMAGTLVRRTLRRGVGITVRDPGSAERLHALGVDNVVVAADPVLGMDPPGVEPHERIVVSLRRHNVAGAATADRKAAQEIDDGWVGSVAGALDALVAETGLEVRFVALQPDRDGPLHATVAARMKSPHSFAETSPANVIDEIATGRFVVAMRYHAAIGGLLAGRPIVALDYSPKMRYLADDVGDGMQIRSAGRIENSELVDALRDADRGRAALGPALARLRERESLNSVMLDRLLEAM